MTAPLDAWRGRYEAVDHGVGQAWTSALRGDDGAWLALLDRPDDERDRLRGRQVEVRGVRDGDAVQAAAVVAIGELELDDPVPPEQPGGRRAVEVVETSLEMHADRAPPLSTLTAPADAAVLTVAASPRYYRYLYDAVGAAWHWWNRKRWSDEQLAAYLALPGVEVHVLHERGVPVGYAELDRRDGASCELVYFGLVPEALGRGLGRWFLTWTIHAAWRDPSLRRLWVHTCTLDGPAALDTYRKAGFTAFRHTRFRSCIVDHAGHDHRPLR